MGFNQEAVFIGGNQFNRPGTAYNGAWTLAIPKARGESGAALGNVTGFAGYTASDGSTTRLLDTVQPVASYGGAAGHGQTLSGVVVNTLPYSQPPFADNFPACKDCLETIDTRITATPVSTH